MSNPFSVAQKYLEQSDRNPAPEPSTSDLSEGDVVAVLIDSEVLGGLIWVVLRDDWRPDPGDLTPVFYASEIPFLRTKSPDTLREIFKVKTAFGGGMVRH